MGTFSDRLRVAFGGASMAEVARRLGLPHATVRNYFQGRLPAADILERIAKETNVSLSWLLLDLGPRYVSAELLPQGEASIFFGDREHEIIDNLVRESGRPFDEVVRELVLEALLARGLVTDEVQSANLIFFGDHIPKLVAMRLMGEIAAGKPLDVFEQDETVQVPEDFVVRGRENIVLRVRGDSMEDEGIFDGDLIIGVEAVEANNGDMVIALIDGDKATVKRFYRERNQIRLEPRSSKHQPMYLSPDRVRIQGVVRGIFRKTM